MAASKLRIRIRCWLPRNQLNHIINLDHYRIRATYIPANGHYVHAAAEFPLNLPIGTYHSSYSGLSETACTMQPRGDPDRPMPIVK